MNMLRCFLLLFFTLQFSGRVPADCQTIEQVIAYSEAEFNSENYPAAMREYQRAWLFCNDSLKAGMELRIADCFYRLNEYCRAAEFYVSALGKTTDDSIRNEIHLEIAACHIHENKLFTALSDLELLNISDYGYQANKRWFLSGVCNWGLNQYEEAFGCFCRSIPAENSAAKEKILELKADHSAIGYPNPKLAGWLSIIPGAGQAYCLEFGPGLNSLVLCGSLILAGYYSLIVFKNNLFLLNLLPWFQRYYAGGINQAIEIAHGKRLWKQDRIYQHIIDIISDNQSLK